MQKTVSRVRIVSLVCNAIMLFATFMPFSVSGGRNTTVVSAIDALYILLGVCVTAVGYLMWFHRKPLYAKIGCGLISGAWCFDFWGLIMYAVSLGWAGAGLGNGYYVHAGWYFMLFASFAGAIATVVCFIMTMRGEEKYERRNASAKKKEQSAEQKTAAQNAPTAAEPSQPAQIATKAEQKPLDPAPKPIEQRPADAAFDGQSERNGKAIQLALRNIQNLFLQKQYGNLTEDEFAAAKDKQIADARAKLTGELNEHDRAVVETAMQEMLVKQIISDRDRAELLAF